jgi:predicted nucleic acid-binding protein
MILIDTFAIYALADRADPQHRRARRQFDQLRATGVTILTHSYVLIESVALLKHRLGFATARTFVDDARAFEMEWISAATHEAAVELWRQKGRRKVSLVDAVSFVVM